MSGDSTTSSTGKPIRVSGEIRKALFMSRKYAVDSSDEDEWFWQSNTIISKLFCVVVLTSKCQSCLSMLCLIKNNLIMHSRTISAKICRLLQHGQILKSGNNVTHLDLYIDFSELWFHIGFWLPFLESESIHLSCGPSKTSEFLHPPASHTLNLFIFLFYILPQIKNLHAIFNKFHYENSPPNPKSPVLLITCTAIMCLQSPWPLVWYLHEHYHTFTNLTV